MKKLLAILFFICVGQVNVPNAEEFTYLMDLPQPSLAE